MEYSTFLGGSSLEVASGIVIDDSGNVYITGGTWSSNFPTTAGIYNEIFNTNIDVFVCKLSMLPKSH